jgi:hypothetical protein
MTGKTFAAQLEDIERLTIEALEYTMRQSISDSVSGAQETQIGFGQGATSFEPGKIPVDTAELANSLTVDGAKGPDSYVVAIANLEIGGKLTFAWTAPHALAIEQGWTTSKGTNVPGRQFVAVNAAKFPDHVKKRAAEARR